jgi:hypothetical protein
MKKLALLILCVLAALAGCDEVQNDDFGGVLGVVGQPAIAGCQVDVYNALTFQSLDSNVGRIATTTSKASGRFAVELKNGHLGRPLILVARPGPNAMYRDFGAVGNPDVVWDAPHEPWVCVVNDWRGGEFYVAINPITTMAFHALMRLPAEEFGSGDLRFDTQVVDGVHTAAAANFGIKVNPSIEGITPPQGSAFEEQNVFYLEDKDRNQSYAYACLQLAVAANDFAVLSGTGDALDFYDAMFEDAQDAVLDGANFGTPVAHLNLVPTVVGREASGASSLMTFISTHVLTAAQEDFLNNARDNPGFDPEPVDILDVQTAATGALRGARVDSFDVQNYPYSGNVVMTIRGVGLRGTDRFVFRSNDDKEAEFTVDRESVGVDGEFQFHSDTELQMRIPDFATTTRTVPSALQVASGSDFRVVRLIVENLPEIESSKRDVEVVLTTDARVTDRTEPLLIDVKIGRVDAALELHEASYGNNVGSTDPGTLNPATDDVYELRVRVTNPGPVAINNFGLDLTLSAFSQLGNPVVADVFGGTAAGRALIFESALPMANLNTGDVAELVYRFMFLDTAIPADLTIGAPVKFTPVLSSGVGTPTTSDVIGFNRTVELGPAPPDPTAQLDALAPPTMPAAVVAGDSFDIQLDFSASPRAGAVMQTLKVTSATLTVVFDGETTVLHLGDAFFEQHGESDLYFTDLVLVSSNGQAFPVLLTQVANGDGVILTVRTDPGRTGALTASFTATAIDVATGTITTQASATSNTTIS